MPKTAMRHQGGGPKMKCPRNPSASSSSNEMFKGNGPWSNKLALREPRFDGEGRGLHGLLVEGSKECNDSKEDDGAEAHRAVHRLARR